MDRHGLRPDSDSASSSTSGEAPGYIPGIYNYCDRWCERCPLTARCQHYAASRAADPEEAPAPADEDAALALTDDLKTLLSAAVDRLRTMAEAAGLDPDDPAAAALTRHLEEREEAAREHPLAHASRAYARLVDDWLDGAENLFETKGDALVDQIRLGIPDDRIDAVADAIDDAVSVLRWYQHQIHVKLMRALRNGLDDAPAPLGTSPQEADGSAKVALLGIDRSVEAWRTLWAHFPDAEDDILLRLVVLERLRTETETLFPNARSFTRPGFDTAEAERETR